MTSDCLPESSSTFHSIGCFSAEIFKFHKCSKKQDRFICEDNSFDPIWPRFTVDVIQFEVKFNVTIFEVKFVEVDIPIVDITHFPP